MRQPVDRTIRDVRHRLGVRPRRLRRFAAVDAPLSSELGSSSQLSRVCQQSGGELAQFRRGMCQPPLSDGLRTSPDPSFSWPGRKMKSRFKPSRCHNGAGAGLICVRLRITRGEVAFYQREDHEDLIMTSMRTLSLAALLAAGMASSTFAATDGNKSQGVTITPNSPFMSAPNTLSHDGNHQLGSMGPGVPGATPDQASTARAAGADDHPGAAASPHTGFSSGMAPDAGTASGTRDGTTDTGATSPGSSSGTGRP
jgi:hypothetical protein